MELIEAVRFGIAIARKMGNDPELESIANIAAWRAYSMWDGRKSFKNFVAMRVKTSIWCYWRKIRDRHEERTDCSWERVIFTEDEATPEYSADFQLLHEYYIDRWPLDVVARRYGLPSKRAAKLAINSALSRFLESCKRS